MKIYEYTDHRQLIRDLLQDRKHAGVDISSQKLAEAAGVTGSFLSQALNDKQEFSNDQVFAISKFFGLGDDEAEYVVLLNEHSRCQSSRRKSDLYRQIERIQHEHLRFVEYIHYDRIDRESSPVDDFLFDAHAPILESYLEDPYYLEHPELLQKKLNLTNEQFTRAIQLMINADIIEPSKNGYARKHGELMIYKINLAAKYNAIVSRLKSIEKIFQEDESDLVGTVIFGANDEFATRVKAEIFKHHNDTKLEFQKMAREDMLFFNFDLFALEEM